MAPSTEPFSFNTIKDFDSHIAQSIPNYYTLFSSIQDLATFFTVPNTQVVDLGCSTGKLLESISHDGLKVGIDISQNLLPKSHDDVVYLNQDITQISRFGNSSLILSVFTLQFLQRGERKEVLRAVYDSLIEGGAFIWAEKVRQPDGLLEQVINNAHYDFKRKHFTATEIMDKEKDLRSLMRPNETLQNLTLAQDVGFRRYSLFWKFYNFEAYLFVK